MTKLFEDGKTKIMGLGECAWELEVGKPALVGSWYTTTVQDITLLGKGVLIETMNSTYLIEETSFTDEDLKDDSKE